MKGHFKKRGASWYFWVELEPGPDGKRRQKSRGGFKTRKDAERAYADLRDEVRRGTFVEPSKLTLNRYLDEEWFPAVRASVRPTTWNHYRGQFEAYVLPMLGRSLLANVTPQRLNSFYAGLLTGGRRHGSGNLSPTTVRHVHTMLHKALSDAVRWGHLPRNAADLAEPPKARSPVMKVWNANQMRTFVEYTREHRLAAAWMLLITTGMRRGEVLGLSWEHLDVSAARLAVVKTLTVIDYHDVRFSEPKTAKGRRSVALDRATVAALERHRKRQLQERLAWGSAWTDTGLVFAREDGTALHPQRLTSWFEQLSREAGLPKIRLHDLRHSYATAGLTAGVPAKVISERLGHASIGITLDTYSHVLPGIQEDAAETVAAMIFGTGAGPVS